MMTEAEAKRARSNVIDDGDADTGTGSFSGSLAERGANEQLGIRDAVLISGLAFALTGYSGCWTGRTACTSNDYLRNLE